jgi:TolA protein
MDREQPTGGLLRTRWDPGLLRMIGFSLGLHVLVVAVIVVMRPWSRERSMPPPPAYTVELTSLTSLGSNVTPGAPGDRLTGGRAEPRARAARPPAPAADMKPGTAAKVPPPPAERAPVPPPPPPVPPKVETPPTVADEPVRLPEPPKAALPKAPEVSKTPPPEAPKPEPPKEVAKAPAPPPAAKPSPEQSEVPAAAVEAKAEKDVPKKPEAPPEKPPAATPKPEQPTQEAKLPAEAPKPAEKPQPAEAPKKPADEAKKPAPQQATADVTKPPATSEKPSAASAETKKAPAQTAERPAQVAASGAEPAPSATQNDAPPAQDTRYAAAIDRVRRRVETGAGGLMGDGDARQAPSIGGAGPGGGNQVVGAEFLIYYNIMISHIKRTWLWVGHDDTLSVTVHFRIGPEGEIGDVRLERPSADATYDESVLRAVREASPLPPPPAAHRRDFGDVRLTFRPGDLRQPG